MSNTIQVHSEPPTPLVALQVIPAGDSARLVFVDHDEFTIGSGDHCDLCLPQADLPRLHSRLHVQGPVIWIEAVDDDALVIVDHEIYRRRALRDGDQLTFGDVEATVHIGEASVRAARQMPRSRWEAEDITLLTAEELCERIEVEEAFAGDADHGRKLGWAALMSAVQAVIDRGIGTSDEEMIPAPLVASVSDEKFDELVAQVRDLSETLDERTKTLATQEALLIESSSQLAEAQLRVSRQLEQLLDRLGAEDDQPGELRVSA
jgi:hypothetical protein